ncbi:hypothetical protein WJX73_001776 [Symbiochloris irregularis]|uniref:Uncharacterized protein n=1 Tax=Symbiochloris irregularis TaxID=706552 RepID=A0AAW1PLA8_9CHLO
MQVADVQVHEIISAIRGLSTPAASVNERAASQKILTQVRDADADFQLAVALHLLAGSQPIEVQHYGYQVLDRLAAERAHSPQSALSAQQNALLAQTAFQMVGQACLPGTTWSIRMKAAALLAVVCKHGYPATAPGQSSPWHMLLPELLKLGSQGPVHMQMACMVIRGYVEECNNFGDCQQQGVRRQQMLDLADTLHASLGFLKQVVEYGFHAAKQAIAAGALQAAQAYADAVNASLDAIAAHMEWCPFAPLMARGIVPALDYLARMDDFCIKACQCLKLLALRRQGQEEEVFQGAMRAVGEALLGVSDQLLQSTLPAAGPLAEFAQLLAESMTTYGTMHLGCLQSADNQLAFMRQMMRLAQHSNLKLAAAVLPFWTFALSEAEPKAKIQAPPKTWLLDMAGKFAGDLSNLACNWMYSKKPAPENFDEPQEWQRFLTDFRRELTVIMKHISRRMPQPALAAASQRVQAALSACTSSAVAVEACVSQLEAAVALLVCVVPAIAEEQLKMEDSARNGPIVDALENLMRPFLATRLADPAYFTAQSTALESLAPVTALRPQLAPALIDRVCDMLAHMPLSFGPGLGPPARLPPGWKTRFTARQAVDGVLLAHAKAAPKAFLQHQDKLRGMMVALSQQGIVWVSDTNVMCDALLAAAAAADPPSQSQVVDSVLAPIRAVWTSTEWQQRLSSEEAFLACFMPLQPDPDVGVQVGGGLARWELYHQIQLLERAAKRLPATGPPSEGQSLPPAGQIGCAGWHALNAHMDWVLPVMLQLIKCLHSLGTPEVQASIAPALAALDVSPKERALHLRISASRVPPEEETTLGGSLISSLRSWLRQIREMVYHTLGFMPSQVPGFAGTQQHAQLWRQALTSHLAVMSTQHLRILVRHVVIPTVSHIQTHEDRSAWVLPILDPILRNNMQRLCADWDATRAGQKEANGHHLLNDVAAKDGIVQEHFLRELTSEHLILLGHLHDGGQQGCTLTWLLQHSPDTALVGIWTAISALWWPHLEGISKALQFCKLMVPYAKQVERLAEWVSRDMLRGAIAALAASLGGAAQDVITLTRDIIALRLPASRQVLMELPGASERLVEEFYRRFEGASQDKDARNAVKSYLHAAGAEEHMQLLHKWRPAVAPATFFSTKHLDRQQERARAQANGAPDFIGIAATAGI